MDQKRITLPADWKDNWTRKTNAIRYDKNKRIRLKNLIWLFTSKNSDHFAVQHALDQLKDYPKTSISFLEQILNTTSSSYLYDTDWDHDLYEIMHRRGSLKNLCLKRMLYNNNDLNIIELDKILILETNFFG